MEASLDLPDFNTSPDGHEKRPIVEENLGEQFVPSEEQAVELPEDEEKPDVLPEDKMEIEEEPNEEKVRLLKFKKYR